MNAAICLAVLLQLAAETLVAPMPKGFKTGFEAKQGGQSIEERVPAGENVETWSRMVTAQRFAGGAALGAQGILERLGGLMGQACPGAVIAPLTNATVEGHATASLRVDCPLNPQTNKPETMFARAWTGSSDIHLVQYAFRSRPTDAEAALASAYLDSVALCPGKTAVCASL